MSYTPFILCILGFAGIFLHNMVKLDSLNRQGKGRVNYKAYLAIEKFTIIISVVVVVLGAFFLQHEISQYFEKVAKYLGFGFLCLGYFAQSIFVVLMGKGQKYIDKIDTDNP